MQDLITLCNKSNVRNLSTFCDAAKSLDLIVLRKLYEATRKNAPKRMPYKSYFVDSHNGIPSSGDVSNRREEHLALALYNNSRNGSHYQLPDGSSLEIIDYQTPLKASQKDVGVGKLDLFGVVDQSLPSVIELKIEGQNNSRADTPLRALLEGLAYCAIVDANLSEIAAEASGKFGVILSITAPRLIVMAPAAYWNEYLAHAKAGPWLPELTRIITGLRHHLMVDIQLIGIKNAGFSMGLDGKPPFLTDECELMSVQQLADGM